jgi:hypothetical protein
MKQFVVLLRSGGFLGDAGEIEFCSCALHFDTPEQAAKAASRFGGSVLPVKPLAKTDYTTRENWAA